jgi:hypothetical protein
MARIYDVVCLNCGETYEWCARASIWLLFKAPNLADKVELLKKRGTVPTEDLCMVLYRKQTYSPSHPAAQSIVKAVEANEKPELVAAACL